MHLGPLAPLRLGLGLLAVPAAAVAVVVVAAVVVAVAVVVVAVAVPAVDVVAGVVDVVVVAPVWVLAAEDLRCSHAVSKHGSSL